MFNRLKSIISSDDLKGKFVRGGFLLTGASIVEIVFRFIRNIILTRLLAPEYFGLMATIISAVAVCEAFAEVGIRQAVIQNKEGNTPEFLNASWWISSARGVFLYLLAFLIAPLVCNFYGTPELLFPMRCAFLVLMFHGLISPRMYLLEKELSYLKLVIINQGSAFLNVAVAVTLSFYFRNLWPLVLGFVTENFCRLAFSHILLPFRIRFSYDSESFKAILRFARGMFGLPILTTIFLQVDVFVIGKLLNMEQLGLYAVSKTLAMVPLMAFSKAVTPLVLPAFSKLQDNKVALKSWLLNITDLTSLFCMPAFAFAIVTSEHLLTLLYGPKYGTVFIPFSILLVTIMVRMLSTILMQLYLALGKPYLQRRFAVARVILVIVLIYPATKIIDLVGASFSIFLGTMTAFVLQSVWAMKLIDFTPKDYLLCLGRNVLMCSVVVVPCIIIKLFVPEPGMLTITLSSFFYFLTWLIAMKIPHYRLIVSPKEG